MILKIYFLLILLQIFSTKKTIDINDKNHLKKELKSHSNILIFFYDNERPSSNVFKLINDISVSANKIAKVLTVDCKANKKLCRQYKVDTTTFVIQHFHKGKFNKVYDRKLRSETLIRFLEDPMGDIPWEEDDSAKDIIHATTAQDLQKLVESYKTKIPPLMLMFYAPWCGYCKKMKPEFAAAAMTLKGKAKFIGINGDIISTEDLKQAFNVTGYPSVFLVLEGSKIYKFENENSKEALIKFIENPMQQTKPKDIPWSEETNEIDFLTDDNFDEFTSQYDSVLVMFYAPWCGHCKAMKPEILSAVKQLKQAANAGRIVAVDCTEQSKVATLFNISSYPTLKYFKGGKFQYNIMERTADGFVKFMDDPKKPQEPENQIPWNQEESSVLHPSADEFKSILKSHKHSLIMFYAPWCGHCKKAKVGFTSAANELKDNPKVAFLAIDCTNPDSSLLCKSEEISGFPTLRYYNYGKITSYSEYSLEREHDDFVAFMKDPINPKLDARRHWKHIPGNEAVEMLVTDTFSENVISKPSGALIMFYVPWCVHSTAMKPAFVSAAKSLKSSLPSCILGSVDASSETKLGAQYSINGFPTLLYFLPNGDWIKYNGERNENEIVAFLHRKDKELNEAEKMKKMLELRELEKKNLENERKEKEELEKKKIEIERKEKEELEKKKLENERKEKEELEKKKIEIERKEKEKLEKKKLETERKEKEELEKQKLKTERKEKEELQKKKLDIERKEIEEKNKREIEEREMKQLEVEKKEREDKERKRQEMEEKDRIEGEKKEKQENERKRKEFEEKENERLKYEKKEQEDNERKRLEIEEKERLEIERKEFKENKNKRSEAEEKKPETIKLDRNENDKRVITEINDQDAVTSSDTNHLTKINDFNELENKIKSFSQFLIYFHKSDKKNHIRKKVLKNIEKYSQVRRIESFDIDCSALVELCDNLGIVDFPSLCSYVNGKKLSSISKTWGEDDIEQLIHSSLRDEL